jgi:uncharacterized protein YjiS (DUF1127 family)
MTNAIMTYRPDYGRTQRWWHWLRKAQRRRKQAAHLDTHSDHMLRDIGISRDPSDRMHTTALETAMRFSRISS